MEKISEVLIESTGQTVKLEGEKGTTFTPSVDANGNLSWTNDGGKQNPTTVNIKGERGEKGDTTVIDPSTGKVYTLYNQTGNHTDGAMTQAAVTEEFEKLDEVYARNDGYYESMGVGTATNLKGQNTVDAEFAYRKSGGNVEVQDGNAMIEAIKGNTIAWNQLIENAKINLPFDFDNTTGSSSQFATLMVITRAHFVAEHKYLLYTVAKVTSTDTYGRIYWTTASQQKSLPCIDTFSSLTSGSLIMTIPAGKHITGTVYSNIIDLTLIYGSGNEPATVEQFEQDYFNWFGKPLTYEPYDAGSLRNTKVSALKTVGFNQYDEIWEEGTINAQGQNASSTTNLRTKNYMEIIPDTDYYYNIPTVLYNSTNGMYALKYDANKTFIGAQLVNYANIPTKISRYANTKYLRFVLTKSVYGHSDYNHDICINISDPNRNGEYEPYKESTLPLNVTTLTGKLNGEGSSVVVFADGMNSAGNVHDEIKIENGVVKAIKRVGKVDLGNKEWLMINVGSKVFYLKWSLIQRGTASKNYTNSKYLIGDVGASAISAGGNDKTLRSYSDGIYIKDTSYSDANTFRAANQGVMLYYELAEPEVYVLDDFNLPKLYPVANGGTEEQLSNSPNSLPATLSIRYGLNAAAFIQNAPKNYISKESMTNFLGNLGSAMGGTWTMTWNSSTNKYDFSFTKNRSVDVEQPIEDK